MKAFMEGWTHLQGERAFSKGSPLAKTYWVQRAEYALCDRCMYWVRTGRQSQST